MFMKLSQGFLKGKMFTWQPCVELMAFGMLGMDVRIDLDK